ncbi:MAG TPA: hypothetical protein VFX37_15190 [Pseudolabrys sp.]|nr:hypothetical protein [Pseudolabrys sp.]
MAPGEAYQSTQPITTEQMIKPAADLAGLVTLGAGAAPAEADALNMGIRAYHGSPHDFDAFDLSKIGTGEGAQAYGHGLYFAENEGVARSYRDALTNGATHVENEAGDRFHPDELTGAENLAARAALKYSDRNGWSQFINRNAASEGQAEEALNILDNEGLRAATPGRMYEVDLNADPEQFLDWDKALNQQPESVQEAFKKVGIDASDSTLREKIDMANGLRLHPPSGGSTIYPREIPQIKGPGAAKFLREAGVPGVKYLDQGSRGAGEGSRNYVVFNHDIISILRKYGLAGLPFAGAAAPIFANNSGDKS